MTCRAARWACSARLARRAIPPRAAAGASAASSTVRMPSSECRRPGQCQPGQGQPAQGQHHERKRQDRGQQPGPVPPGATAGFGHPEAVQGDELRARARDRQRLEDREREHARGGDRQRGRNRGGERQRHRGQQGQDHHPRHDEPARPGDRGSRKRLGRRRQPQQDPGDRRRVREIPGPGGSWRRGDPPAPRRPSAVPVVHRASHSPRLSPACPCRSLSPLRRAAGVTPARDNVRPSQEGYPADIPRASDHQDRSAA